MIYAQPGNEFTAVAEGFPSGLVGTISVQIERKDGTTALAPSTSGIVEVESGSGTYVAGALIAPTTKGTYIVLWKNGSTYASEELLVAIDAPAPTSLAGSSPKNLSELRSRIGDLAGFDLSATHRDSLINEGHRELAIRSEWYRAEIELGPTVAEERRYDTPDDVARILEVAVDGREYSASDRNEIARLDTDSTVALLRGVNGLWWNSYSASAAKQVGIYPTPDAGSSISALCILRPPILSADEDVPVVPEEYRNAIIDYVAAIYYGNVEDNADLRSFYQDTFDRKVAELRRLVTATGRAPVGWRVN